MSGAKHILVIDDDTFMLELLTVVLSREGYQVDTAKNLAELDKRLHAFDQQPDLVLVDVHMPELEGDQIALMLRMVRNVRVPTFLVSAMDEVELAAKALDAGATGWICKSAGIGKITDKVNSVLRPS